MIVVSNASPLISLAKIDYFYLLEKIFKTIFISDEIYYEIVFAGENKPGSREVKEARWIDKRFALNRKEIENIRIAYNLGSGEASSIILAKELKTDLLLVDEKRARIVANSYGMAVIGTLGFIEICYEKRLVTNLKEIYQKMKEMNIRLDENLINNSLKRFGIV
ncbi:MAG: DUF3368 domain-containing protein [Nitrospirae bacterium]|nr:DUF3368 domain-containing protein [Nitrospirota bacterium]